jgi:hypothetical protein
LIDIITDGNVQMGTEFIDGILNTKVLTGAITFVRENDNSAKALPFSSMQPTLTNNTGYSWFVIGSGTTPVTYDDYNLENAFSNQIAVNSSSFIGGDIIYHQDSNTFTKTCSYDYQAKEDIVVGEIGVVYNFGTSNTQRCLVYREVLETPISVAIGQYFTVSLTTTVSANSNKPANYSATVTVE